MTDTHPNYRRLYNLIPVIVMLFSLSSCTTTQDAVKPPQPQPEVLPEAPKPETVAVQKVEQKTKTSDQVKPPNQAEEQKPEVETPVELTGIIFAKSVFEGVLKTKYVQLHVEGLGENTHQFELIIGEKDRKSSLPWSIKTVEPGYFHVELPEGRYRITSLSIPVGSTLAEEPVNMEFEVIPDAATYIGTLKVNGTKEKIRLGGVPVIRPGFEYKAEVIDEQHEGFNAMREILPDHHPEFKVKLLRINSISENPTSLP